MNTSLFLTAFVMGLFGGPHCLAMCGATCVGLSRGNGLNGHQAVLKFQVGRLFGYSALGALGALSVQGVGWLSIHSALFRPVWGLFHVSALLIGVVLIWRAEQPLWLDTFAKNIWRKVATQGRLSSLPFSRFGPFILGVLWSLLPCGLLYSALWVAALSANPIEGALVMSAFTLGSALVLSTGPLIWRVLKSGTLIKRISFKTKSTVPGSVIGSVNGTSASPVEGAWGVRIAGAALVAVSAFALWHGLIQSQAPWCVTSI